MWPDGNKLAVSVTVDIDAETMWTSRDPGNSSRPAVLSQAGFEIKYGIDLFLDLFEELSIPATFFVPGWVAEKHGEVIKRIADAGHELANHGYDHARISNHPPEYERWALERTNEALERLSGQPVLGYRAGYFEVTRTTLETMSELGMKYSSNFADSLMPYTHEDSDIVEVPTSSMWDDGPYYLFATEPPNYRQMYPPSVVHDMWLAEFEAMREMGGVMTPLLHPQLSARPSRLAALARLLRTMKEQGAYFATCATIAQLRDW